MAHYKLHCLALFFWLISFILLQYCSCSYAGPSGLLQILPERLRSFVAAYLWEKADHLMHHGPVVDAQKFTAGAYGGNTDIVPLLKMVIALCPDQVAPYRLLATNYAYHLGMRSEAFALLDKAKKDCAKSVNYHELFAAEAFIRIFSQNSREEQKEQLDKALALINEAISCYQPDEKLPDPAFKLENYYIVKSRLHWELHEPEKALESWKNSGASLEDSKDTLARFLNLYRTTGKYTSFKD